MMHLEVIRVVRVAFGAPERFQKDEFSEVIGSGQALL